MTSTEIGLIASIYLVGEVFGALVFGQLSDQLGRKRLLIVTLLLYLCGTGLAAFRDRPSHGLAGVLLRHAVHRGDGHRRPVRGDQLRDRRDDAVQVPRPCRHLDQRHVLGGGDPRLVRVADLPQRVRGQCRLAAGVPDGPGAGADRDRGRAHAAREPALADDPRPGRGGREPSWRRSRRRRSRPGRRSSRSTTARRSSWCRRSSTATSRSCGWCSTSTRSGRSSARR